MEPKQFILGVLVIMITATSIYIIMPDAGVKMRIDADKSVFYVQDGRWLISGEEWNKLFDGSSLVRRHAKDVKVEEYYDINEKTSTFIRTTPYSSGATIVDTYVFDGMSTDVEQFPVSHTIEIHNAVGLIYQYEVRRLSYTGATVKGITSPQSFGMNMKVEYDDGYYYSKIYKYFGRNQGKLTVKYRITEDYVKLDMRLFDPPTITILLPDNTTYPSASRTINWSSDETTDWTAYSLNAAGNVSLHEMCYQETATTATSCGGLSTGAYGGDTGDYDSYANAWDGNWVTSTQCSLSDKYLNMNYSKPADAKNDSLWQVSDDNAGVPTPGDIQTRNITLSSDCWDQEPLQVRIFSSQLSGHQRTRYYCYNGASWDTLYTRDSLSKFREEAMFWNMQVNTTVTGQEGSNSVIIWANNSAGEMSSSEVYFTVDTTAPTITINYPLNATTDSGLFNVTFDETVDWSAYSLNGAANVSMGAVLTYETTFTSGFVQGSNYITVHANDSAGNMNSTTRYFTSIPNASALSYGSGMTGIEYKPTNMMDKYVAPEGQTSTNPSYYITSSIYPDGDLEIWLDSAMATDSWLTISNTSDYSDGFNLTASAQTLNYTVAQSTNVSVWVWLSLDYPSLAELDPNPGFNFNFTY